MSRFKDSINADLTSFINPDEFGQLHDVNGRQILVVFDADILKEYDAYRNLVPTDGIFTGRGVVFIKSSDLPTPAIGSVFRLEGKLYLVIEVSESMGILEVTLEANET
ncbi:MAG: hypothetical protein ACOX0F_13845 [Syntrophomonadaceae bacterium]